MYSKPRDPDPYWKRRQRDPETNAEMVCVFVVIDEVVYFYRFIEKDGKLMLHSCQSEHQLDMGQSWIIAPEKMMDSILRFGFFEAFGKARRELGKWAADDKFIAERKAFQDKNQTEIEANRAEYEAKRQAELKFKLEMERKATLEVERKAALEAEREAEKARAEAERDRLNKERVKEEERKKRIVVTYIGIVGYCVVMVGVYILFAVSALWGILIAGVGFTVAAVCFALVYTKSFAPPPYRDPQTTQPRQSYQPQQTAQPKRFKYTWEMSDDEKNAMLLGRLQNDYMHHKNK